MLRDFGERGTVLDVMASNWSSDPHSSMTWSYLPVNSTASDMDTYAEAVGDVYFAGEGACRLLYGTVHAAVASALRAVHAIVGDSKWPLFASEIRKACYKTSEHTATKLRHAVRRAADAVQYQLPTP